MNARLACSLLSSTSLPALLIAGLVAVAMTPIVSGAAFGGPVIDIQDGVTINNDLTIDLSQTMNVGSGTGTYSGRFRSSAIHP